MSLDGESRTVAPGGYCFTGIFRKSIARNQQGNPWAACPVPLPPGAAGGAKTRPAMLRTSKIDFRDA